MHTIYQKIILAIKDLFSIVHMYHNGIQDDYVKKIPRILQQHIFENKSKQEFLKAIHPLLYYIHFFRNSSTQTLAFIRLKYYLSILKGPEGKYKIGDCVKHLNKTSHIVDYIYQLDLYEIKYTDASVFGETLGWFRDSDLTPIHKN